MLVNIGFLRVPMSGSFLHGPKVPTNNMSSNAWWDCVENPKDRGEKVFYKPLYKRVPFLEHGKKAESSARNAYNVVIWGK